MLQTPSRRPGLDPRPFHLKFVAERMPLGQVLVQELWFSPVTIMAQLFRTHTFTHLVDREQYTVNLTMNFEYKNTILNLDGHI